MSKCKSFLPQISSNSKVLILGSMPGVKSLETQEYYAHPQNRFWKLMGRLCGICDLHELDYETKIRILLDNEFALWDVLKGCEREGSLDTNIKNEIPNEIVKLLKRYPNIKKICLNGGTSYKLFRKYFSKLLQEYNCNQMLSTSPANARYNLEDLYEIWKKFLDS